MQEVFENLWGMMSDDMFKPTIFSDVIDDMQIAREEIFCLVLVIIPFEDELDAILIANDNSYGLAGYIQKGDPKRAECVASKLRAGAVHMNGSGIEDSISFDGYKQSGDGREGRTLGLEYY